VLPWLSFFLRGVGRPNLQTGVSVFQKLASPAILHNVTRTFFPIGSILCLPSEGREGKGKEDLLTSKQFPKEKEKKTITTQLLAIINNFMASRGLPVFFWKF
jgi:hypothetical protein